VNHPDVVLFFGTRPQVIKACVMRPLLASRMSLVSVDTGQHYDYALNALLYEQLGVTAPDRFLEVGSGGHAQQTGTILERGEALLQQLRPRLVVVIGDTNSTLGGALAAAKLRIPVVHVEAGLRAQDALMAEEINRRVVDAVSSLLCTPSATATRRLQRERPDAKVIETGDVAYDGFRRYVREVPRPIDVPSRYIFATLHRAELTDRPERLQRVMDALRELPLPVLLPLHPRTSMALHRAGIAPVDGQLRLMPPVGYFESLSLLQGAQTVITDSGGVQREAYWSGIPCVTLRSETEWIETVECGANVLVDPDLADADLKAVVLKRLAIPSMASTWDVAAYGNGNAAERVADAVADFLRASA